MAVYVAGRINIDFIIKIDDVMTRGRKYRGKVVEVDVGGTAANIATAIARVDKSLNTVLLGAIGLDYKDLVLEKLGIEGIDLRYVRVLNSETGKAFVFIDSEGESTIISIPGANDLYSEEHVPSIEDARALVLGNTMLSSAIKLLNSLPRDAFIFIDPHDLWVNIWDKLAFTNNKCFYLPNEVEFKVYANVDVNDLEAVKKYANRVRCSIIVKRGEKGAIAIHEDKIIKVNAIKLNSLGLNIVSTAGCGDTFTGVFVATYLKYRDIIESLKYATIAAAFKTTKLSSRASPYIDELKYLAEYIERKNFMNISVH
ncbi:MAG: carbohydrate kinase family protein [Ignisphaera sp.]|uniref:Carbohydrate kinase family protein n=1 Tax=Ignisphaera aggregans TaxID=334771 RepID=A0A7C4NKQ1_9CREN